MTQIHRFVPGLVRGLCYERFGGVAACRLPESDPLHDVSSEPPTEVLLISGTVPWEVSEPRTEVVDLGGATEFRTYTNTNGSLSDFFSLGESVEPQRPWEKAVRALADDEARMVTGPWTWRKYRVDDSPTPLGDDQGRFEEMVRVLLFQGAEFTVTAWRPEDREYRFVFIAWGDYRDMTPGEVAADMEASFG